MESIDKSAVYARELEAGYLLGFYYLVFWKNYYNDKSTWELASAILHLRKLISTFHKNHPNKPTAISLSINLTSLIAKHTTLLNVNSKRKRG